MSFNKYYQDELSFLREMGREFAQAYPEAAHFLAEKGSDPDVERLLEGVAFLTGRIRQKLDDELPEVTHALMSLLLPHYLRPVPPVSLVEFQPIRGMVEKPHRVARGTDVASVPVDGTSCRFRTCFDVDLSPVAIDSVSLHAPAGGRPELRVRFAMDARHSAASLGLSTLRLFLGGDSPELLYLWLCRRVEQVSVRPAGGPSAAADLPLPGGAVRPVGFDRETALLPYGRASLDGFRLLQEYFLFPEKYLFVDVGPLDTVRDRLPPGPFELAITFSPGSREIPKVEPEDVRLFCTPVINLFSIESEPLVVDHARSEYRVVPAGADSRHFEIYSIDRASGWTRGAVEEHAYEPLYSFRTRRGTTGSAGGDDTCYQARVQQAVAGDGTETYVTFVHPDQRPALPPTETVVFQLTCTNRRLAARLRAGDIRVATDSSPTVARFRNITRVSPGAPVPVEGDLHWRLISHVALNALSLSSAETLRDTLRLYNFESDQQHQAARANQLRIDGILSVESRPDTALLGGVPVRGLATRLVLKESHFRNEGDLYLFGSVVNEFLSLCVSLNTFTRLTVVGADKGETYEWPARLGRQAIL